MGFINVIRDNNKLKFIFDDTIISLEAGFLCDKCEDELINTGISSDCRQCKNKIMPKEFTDKLNAYVEMRNKLAYLKRNRQN